MITELDGCVVRRWGSLKASCLFAPSSLIPRLCVYLGMRLPLTMLAMKEAASFDSAQ